MKEARNHLSAGQSLFTSIRWPTAKQPKRAEVLGLLDKTLPWQKLEEVVRPHYSSDTQRSGRPGVSLKMLLRCHVLQSFWKLSDEGTEAMILDSHAACCFIGCDPWQPRPPSASRIRGFRKLLDDISLEANVEWLIGSALAAAGLQCRPGTIREPVFRRAPSAAGMGREAGAS